MKVVNQSKYTVYWRTFGKGDSSQWFGLQDGLLKSGASTTFTSVDPKVQIEFKWSGVLGSFIRRANPDYLYDDDHTFTIGADDKLTITTPPVAPKVTFAPSGVEQGYYGTTYKFFNLLEAPDTDIEQQVVLAITEAHSSGHESESSHESNVSWGLTLSLAGEDAGASGSWSSTVSDALKTKFSATASLVRSSEQTMTYTALGGRLNVLQCHWNTNVEVGTATCAPEKYDYRATLDVSPSVEVATFNSLDDAPKEILDAWKAHSGKT